MVTRSNIEAAVRAERRKETSLSMSVRRILKISAALAAMLAAGAVLLVAPGEAYAAKVNNGATYSGSRTIHGGCHAVTTKICPAGHPPLGGPCRSVTRWVC
jgi:hypothetical protein